MKTLLRMSLLAAMLVTLANGAEAQQEMRQRPDCEATLDSTGGGTDGIAFDNRTMGCTVWYFFYFSNGFSAVSITVQSAPDANGVAGTFATWPTGQTLGGLPKTAITYDSTTLVGFQPWVRLRQNTATGTGRVIGRLYGFRGQVPANYVESGVPAVPVASMVRQVQATGTSNNPTLSSGFVNCFDIPGAGGCGRPLWAQPFAEGTEISTVANTAVKATAGTLNYVTVNNGAAGTIELWDATSANCTATPTGTRRGIITTVAGTSETFWYNMRMANGICVRTVTAVGNITVGWN